MLQGKGGCYKHTFYGIASHQCMEHTPNVSCANKCIFCWRNHINPVALDWKFDTDDPEEILEESLRKHYATIDKQCLSPNALEHRKAEARQVRHCALSLVGEPVAGSCFQPFIYFNFICFCYSTCAHTHKIFPPPKVCISSSSICISPLFAQPQLPRSPIPASGSSSAPCTGVASAPSW